MSKTKDSEATVERIINSATSLFFKKGYDNTTIDDIVCQLGDLSKGAIYHHFKSKEEIFISVIEKLNKELLAKFHETIENKNLTALEKAKQFILFSLKQQSCNEPCEHTVKLLDNPKLLALQMQICMYVIAPKVILPFIEEGMRDGSIKTEQPHQLSQMAALMVCIWMNPLVFGCTKEELSEKYKFFKSMLLNYGIDLEGDELLDYMYNTMDKM